MQKIKTNFRLILKDQSLSAPTIAKKLGEGRKLIQYNLKERLADARLLKAGYELQLFWAHHFSDLSGFEGNGFEVLFDYEAEETNLFIEHCNEHKDYKDRLKTLVESLDETNIALPLLKETLEKLENNFFGRYQGGYAG